MAEDGGDNVVLVNVAKVVLLLVNMAFMVAGAMLVYFSHRVKTSGWLDAFQGDYAWVGTSTFLFTLILGAVVMTLAALGCFGALLRQKLLLTIYAVVLIITLGFFVVVAIGAHSANSKATDWGAAEFPAVESEVSVGENFNQLYCAAQVPYYCVDAGINDVLSMFNQSLPGYFSSSTTNFTSLCGVVNVAQVQTVCTVCELVAKYDKYSPVLDWAQDKCPRNAKNQVWCGAFLLSGGNVTSQGSAVTNNAPYGQCRPVFFDLIKKWSSFLLGSAIGVCVATIAIFALTLVLRHQSVATEKEDELYPPAVNYPRANSNAQQYGGNRAQQQYGNTNEQQYGYGNEQQQQQYGQQQQQYGNEQYGYNAHHQQLQQQQYGNAPNQRIDIINCGNGKREALSSCEFHQYDAKQSQAADQLPLDYFALSPLLSQADNTLGVLHHTNNARFCRPRDHKVCHDEYPCLAPSFASGNIFLSSVLDRIVCQSFYNPYITDVIESLAAGGSALSTTNSKSFADGFGHTSGRSFRSAANVSHQDQDRHRRRLFRVEVAENFVGGKFLEVFMELLGLNMLVIDILRYPNPVLENLLPYVYTCPDPETVLHANDKLFVLG